MKPCRIHKSDFVFRKVIEKMMQERDIVALEVLHGPTHPGKAFTEPQVVSWIVFGWFPMRPVPSSTVLDIHYVYRMFPYHRSTGLNAQIIHATEALLEHLRCHDRRAHGQYDATVQAFHRPGKKSKINSSSAPNCRTTEDRVIRNNVVADSGMNRKRQIVAKGLGQDAGVFPAVPHLDPPYREPVRYDRLQ